MLWGNTIMLGVIFSLGKYDMNYDAVNLAAFYSIPYSCKGGLGFFKRGAGIWLDVDKAGVW